jgi:hypothetical protein
MSRPVASALSDSAAEGTPAEQAAELNASRIMIPSAKYLDLPFINIHHTSILVKIINLLCIPRVNIPSYHSGSNPRKASIRINYTRYPSLLWSI